MKRFKESFGIKSKSQLILVFIVFGIAGTISAAISAPYESFWIKFRKFPRIILLASQIINHFSNLSSFINHYCIYFWTIQFILEL